MVLRRRYKSVYTTHKQIAAVDNHSVEYIRKAIKQRFLSPKIIEAIVDPRNSNQIDREVLTQYSEWNWKKQEMFLFKNTSQ